jgi:hypothetical protein
MTSQNSDPEQRRATPNNARRRPSATQTATQGHARSALPRHRPRRNPGSPCNASVTAARSSTALPSPRQRARPGSHARNPPSSSFRSRQPIPGTSDSADERTYPHRMTSLSEDVSVARPIVIICRNGCRIPKLVTERLPGESFGSPPWNLSSCRSWQYGHGSTDHP